MKGLRTAFGFFTIIPVGGTGGGLASIGAAGLWLPVVAVLLGGAEGLAAWGLLKFFTPAVTAALVLTLALLLTGLHHTDGLADLGDAVMAGGDRARRLAVLKDRTTGAGAVAALILVYLVTWAALTTPFTTAMAAGTAEKILGGATDIGLSQLPWVLIAAEVSARLSLLLTAMMSRPSHAGSGKAFIDGLKGWRGGVALLLAAAALAAASIFLPDPKLVLAAASAALLTAAAMTLAAKKWFGGANGDVLGAAVEIGRMTALLAMAASAS